MLNGCMTLAVMIFTTFFFGAAGVFVLVQPPVTVQQPPQVVTGVSLPTTAPILATPTITASVTPIPTNTATFTATHTATTTPSATMTSTPTATTTPSPTDTFTPTNTATATVSPSPTFTPTPAPLCRVRNGRDALINLRANTNVLSEIIVQIPPGVDMDVFQLVQDIDNFVWYYVEVAIEGEVFESWVRADLVNEITPCPR